MYIPNTEYLKDKRDFFKRFISFSRDTKTFYNNLYSPSYILRHSLKGTIYSRIMTQNALHQLLWRIKLPWLSANFKKLIRL